MPAPVLVDSNVYIALLRRGLDPARVLGEWAGDRDLATCGMIRLEVLRGIRTPRVQERVSAFLEVLINIPTTESLWNEASTLAWHLDRAGLRIPSTDILIAAAARAAGAIVLTDDRHFDHVPGIVRVASDALYPDH